MTKEELQRQAFEKFRESIRLKLLDLSTTPAGRVVRAAGDQVAKAKAEGRSLNQYDLAAFCMSIPDILVGGK